MVSDREALYAAILHAPDDDTPRLVYADWLQEHGEEDRAEFIRVQIQRCRAAGCGRCADCRMHLSRVNPKCEMHGLRRREKQLLAAHDAKWFPELYKAGMPFTVGSDTAREEEHKYKTRGFTTGMIDRGFLDFVFAVREEHWFGPECTRCEDYLDEQNLEGLPVDQGHLDRCEACSGAGFVGGFGVVIAALQPDTATEKVKPAITETEVQDELGSDFFCVGNSGTVGVYVGKRTLLCTLASREQYEALLAGLNLEERRKLGCTG